MRVWIFVALSAAVACTTPNGELTHGPVTLITQPHTRVDFMSHDSVFASGVTDAAGRAEVDIDLGDRAVIVMDDRAIVLDQLGPGREYTWLFPPELPTGIPVTVTWGEVPRAKSFRVRSRCTPSGGPVTSPATIEVCPDGDAILVAALSDIEVINYAYRTLPTPTTGATISFDDAFEDPRSVGFLHDAPIASEIDATATFFTNDGVPFEIAKPFIVTDFDGGFALPKLAGTVRIQLDVCTGWGAKVTAIDSHEITDSHESRTLNFPPFMEPGGDPMFDAASSTLSWRPANTHSADAVFAELHTTARPITLVTPYVGTSATVPALPPDLGEITALSALEFALVDGNDYHATVTALGKRFERNPLGLFLSTFHCEP